MAADNNSIDLEAERRTRLADALIRTGKGDRSAFETVYKQTSAKLFGVCLRIFPDRTEAEEALQEAYLTIWNKAASFEAGRASPISWLATIARNRAIDWRRSAGRAAPARIEDIAELADDRASAEETMLVDERAAQLHGCLDQLDQRQRDAIRTAFFDGLTYAELAERDAVPLGTMKSWVRRGLLRLKDCLGDA